MTKPYPFQREDISKINGRNLIVFEVGLGKTFFSLWWMVRNSISRAAVVCPWGIKHQWQAEALRHFGMSSQILESTQPPPPHEITQPPPLTIVNYEILGSRQAENGGPGQLPYLKSLNLQLVIIDEGQRISNRHAKQTRWVRELCEDVPFVLVLTATPLTSRPAQLWSLANLLWPRKFPSFIHFGQRYCQPTTEYGKLQFRGAVNLPELNRRLVKYGMLRRRKKDVLQDLPKMRRIVLPLPIVKRDQYEEARDHFIQWLSKKHPNKIRRVSRLQRLVQMGYLLRLTWRLKYKAVCEWVDEFLESGEKLALFCVHRKLVARLHKRYPNSVVVNGETSRKDRRRAVERFQSDPKCRLFIGNIRAAGTGLDGLQRSCSTGAFVELPWTPSEVTQVIGRLDRLGQKSPVNFYFLTAVDTIEELLCKVLQRKAKTLSAVLDGGEQADDLDIFSQLEALLKKQQKEQAVRNS